MKNIAIVTGASSGMGKEFATTVQDNISVDEMWVIARRKERLEELQKEVNIPLKVIALDLSIDESFKKIGDLLKKEKPSIKLLINASGYGKFEKITSISNEDNMGMIDLNVKALTNMCLTCIPYMQRGSQIINFASVAAFQPVPYINVYAATKAYVLSFSRSLNVELKNEGIKVLAVCPFWTKTEFFDRAVTENKVIKKYVAMYNSKDVVKKAWKDYKKGKDISIYGFNANLQRVIGKLLPHRLIMSLWLKQQKIK
ncbi:MAG: SDR family NAD(P)-dependent oxidoreductase [Bacilli bacterium]|nr:SDR family NAD(P)-dependent oxidoreductase [Bacilli bacterium]